ncbi:MAG: helix-turn-helix transcriptional regulator [Planctomycetes bacterium]|nr:helix-turn-helix transcriptional regulator [Planctomycetota bacterium]MCD7895448.1 helix-turn-helix transcriptional regulator [Planctomycetaceae bacterium]
MGKMPEQLRETIARNIRQRRLEKYPGRGGGKRCAEEFGVSPQQWSPWESGRRTPDEVRLQQIATFFGTTVEWLRTDHNLVTDISANSPNAQPAPNASPSMYRLNYQILYELMVLSGKLHQLCATLLSEGIALPIPAGAPPVTHWSPHHETVTSSEAASTPSGPGFPG